MSEKLICWIDNDENDMRVVAEGVIQKLWQLEEDDGIRSKIMLVGDASDFDDVEKFYSEDDEKEFRWEIEDIFVNACKNIQGMDPLEDLFEKKKYLINDPFEVVFKDADADVKRGFYSELNTTWSRKDLGHEDDDYNNAKPQIKKLISKMNIPSYALVGIDVLLLNDDYYRIVGNKRIVSMELYSQLTEAGYTCFLYSSDADNKLLISNWNKLYRELYKNEGEDIEILLRRQLSKKDCEKAKGKLKTIVQQIAGEKV